MNRFSIFAGAFVILALPGALHADQRGTRPNAGGPGRRIIQYLNLSPQQQAQLGPLMRGSRQQIMAIKTDPSLTPDQKRERLKEIHQQTNSQVGQILTPDQQMRLRQLRQWQKQQRQQQNQPQQPQPQPSPQARPF